MRPPTSNRTSLLCFLPAAIGTLLPLSGFAQAQPPSAKTPALSGAISLRQALEIGVRESLLVQIAQSEAGVAIAETQAARSQTRPQISANAYLAYGDMGGIFYSAPGVMPNSLLAAPPQGIADQNITLMLPLFTGGRLQNLAKAAKERENAAKQSVREAQAESALRIRDAYYRALLAAETQKAAQARAEATQEMTRTATALYEQGKGLEASAKRAQAEEADAKRNLVAAKTAQSKALLDLKAAMSVPLESEITLSDRFAFSPPKERLAEYLAQAAQSRPELLALRANLAAAKRQTEAAQAARGAQIYGMAMADASASNAMGNRGGYSLGIVASLPLSDAGERRAEAAKMRSMQTRAALELRDMEIKVANEVRQAWLDSEAAATNYQASLSAFQSAQAAYEVIALRVQNQKSLLLEQLDALATLTQARTAIAQALYDHALALARLLRAVGRA